MFLDVANADQLPQGWARYAQFILCVHNFDDPSRTVERSTFRSLIGI